MPARTAEVLVLGSGTSTGVPLIGCACPVCTSSDPRDVRARCGLHVSCEGFALQIDVSPDCTMCADPALYFSHRRMKGVRGTQGAGIVIVR